MIMCGPRSLVASGQGMTTAHALTKYHCEPENISTDI
jgi:hypothetical protein